jgi:hypothetical protein
MDAAPPDGWTGHWQITRDDDADAYGVQLNFLNPGDDSKTNGHVVIPRGEPPLLVTREAGTFTLHGAAGDRSGTVSFVSDAAVTSAWRERLGRPLNAHDQLCHALFDLTLAYDAAFRELLPEANVGDTLSARLFGADLPFVREYVAAHDDATPRSVVFAAMRRRSTGG